MGKNREENGTGRCMTSGQRRRAARRRAQVRCRLFCVLAVLGICTVAVLASVGLNSQPKSYASETRNIDEYSRQVDQTENNSDTADTASDTADNDWTMILVNKWNTLPDNYEVDLTEVSDGQSVDSRIYEPLMNMLDAARADGVYGVVAAGYRTTEKQQSLMDEKIADLKAEGYTESEAETEAERWVAVPGTSEHQLGLAVDINADGIHTAGSDVYAWLAEHAHSYGFILRYPEDKEDITGTAYEGWHYRYVGIDAATEIYEQGICLEEYLEK